MSQPPYQPSPKRSVLAPLLVIGGLVLLLALVIGTAVTVVVLRTDDKPSATGTPAVRAKPSEPKAVEFRRVLTSKPGTCATPAPDGTACDDKGMLYTLGKVELDGSHVTEVKSGHDSTNNYWYVNITLDPEGEQLFAHLTGALAKQVPPANLLAIVVHGRVVSAPSVQSEITGGQVQITGNFDQAAVEALAKQITG
ncbi:hypothetical protein GCM10009630_48750 [Kribbella jejuensis]|uniref:SecDF P1 head subdomain domain-containing protein n=1 Tax=Kribbella jejuensis TaxID=236068 RepID=A0A542E7G5_9ACTN|nr:hypothetical protein [Kribbella jejuensis]TQJ11265.1 hypothetical protein FB475_4174 [Kribbella jejuensis]